MPKRFNISHSNVVPNLRHDVPAIKPGESFDFEDDEVETLGADWSDEDPRSGLKAETAWKAKRDKKSAAAEPELLTESAESVEQGESK